MKRDKRWDLDLSFGQIGEDLIEAIMRSQNCTVEVKRDGMVSKTGNVAIEFRCNGKLSGISVSKADWYALVLADSGYDDEVIVFMRVERLKKIAKRCYTRKVTGGDGDRSEMLLVPVEKLLIKLQRG